LNDVGNAKHNVKSDCVPPLSTNISMEKPTSFGECHLMKTILSATCGLLGLIGLAGAAMAQTAPSVQNPLRPSSPPITTQPTPMQPKMDDKSKSKMEAPKADMKTDDSAKPKAERSEAQKANDDRMRACGKEWRENKEKLKAAGKTWKTFGPECRAKMKAEGK
jgi:hypothetical protein